MPVLLAHFLDSFLPAAFKTGIAGHGEGGAEEQPGAAIQILLECFREEVGEGGRLRAVQETNSQVCCYLARMCRAFPPLIEDCIQLLAQAATMWISAQIQSVTQYHGAEYCMELGRMLGAVLASGHSLTQEIVKTFDNILSETVLVNRM